jgi:methylated-DNA-protein-cysteine methyltransferase related protein
MPHEQSDEASWWFHAVYSAIQQIPYGRVTSYGHIAVLLGFPKRARQVGVCLKHLPDYDPTDPDQFYFHGDNVPWQRVINSKGGISPRGDGGLAANRQAVKLREEGVEVLEGRGMEEAHVDFSVYGWFPDRLPNDEDDDDQSEVEVKSESNA